MQYKVTFKSDEAKKIFVVRVRAVGICPAIEEAIRKMIVKPTKGAFYYPIKAELATAVTTA